MLFFKSKLEKLEAARQKLIAQGRIPVGAEPLYAAPLPNQNTPLDDLKFTALDFETTGLNFAEDCVLSFGGVDLQQGQIDFASGFHHFVNNAEQVKKGSAIINQITPEQLTSGLSPAEAVRFLCRRLAGRIIICHAAVIERTFLLKLLGLGPEFALPLIFLDTLKIERSLMHRGLRTDELRLDVIRQKRGLPAYVCHNALADSVAAAEVFLAQVKDVFGKGPGRLGPLYERSI